MKANVALEALDSTDCDMIRGWRNDFNVMRWTRQSDFISDVEQKDWFERQSNDPTIKMYRIRAKVIGDHGTVSDDMVGVCGLTSMDYRNSRAEFSLYIASRYQRKGYGRVALGLLLHHAFINLGFRQIWGETFEGNPAAKIFEMMGMQRDGSRRQFYWKNGAFHDAHLYSILRDEYAARLAGSRDPAERAADGEPSSDGNSLPDQEAGREPSAETASPLVEAANQAKARGDRRRQSVADGARREVEVN